MGYPRKFLILALCVLFITTAFGGDQPPLSRQIQQQLTAKYPKHKMVNWCSGKFVGEETDAVDRASGQLIRIGAWET